MTNGHHCPICGIWHGYWPPTVVLTWQWWPNYTYTVTSNVNVPVS
jgi:hypothetical protein